MKNIVKNDVDFIFVVNNLKKLMWVTLGFKIIFFWTTKRKAFCSSFMQIHRLESCEGHSVVGPVKRGGLLDGGTGGCFVG